MGRNKCFEVLGGFFEQVDHGHAGVDEGVFGVGHGFLGFSTREETSTRFVEVWVVVED